MSERRPRGDGAPCVRARVAVPSPDAEAIVRVLDQLNPHAPAALSEAFPPAEAQRLAAKRAIPHTPKHGRWLTMAESELSAVQRQGLDRRLADRATAEREGAAWVAARTAAGTTIDWRFTTADARITRKHLSPAVHA